MKTVPRKRKTVSELEAEKLRLEIKQANRWWWNANSLRNYTTIIIAVITLYLTIKSGLLDTQKATLELKKEKLEDTIESYKAKADSLTEMYEANSARFADSIMQYEATITGLADTLRHMNARSKELTTNNKMLENKNSQLSQHLKALNNSISFLNRDIFKLKEEKKNLKKEIEQLTESVHENYNLYITTESALSGTNIGISNLKQDNNRLILRLLKDKIVIYFLKNNITQITYIELRDKLEIKIDDNEFKEMLKEYKNLFEKFTSMEVDAGIKIKGYSNISDVPLKELINK